MSRFWLAAGLFVSLLALLWLTTELVPPAGAWRATAIEAITGQTPEARIAAYASALARGDEKAAIAAWELPEWNTRGGVAGKLDERRKTVTRELIGAGIKQGYRILAVEWWRTCCEPAVITDPRSAGGARIDVELQALDGRPLRYRFDVFARGGAYWGAAMAYPPREWSLRDVYPPDQDPLFWNFADSAVISRDE